MGKNKSYKISKYLSYTLRHNPSDLNLEIDEAGWVSVEELIENIDKSKFPLDMEMLEEIVETNDKQRFAFNEDKTLIRASQGHSIGVDLKLLPNIPPNNLFHGTQTSYLKHIMDVGLSPMTRDFVHLSEDYETAVIVAKRRGEAFTILIVDTGKMLKDGYIFYKSDNGVWLTNTVKPEYITTM